MESAGEKKTMERCDYCAYRNSWDCGDGWNRTKNYDLCKYFELDWNTLKWKQQKAIQEVLMEEDEGEY